MPHAQRRLGSLGAGIATLGLVLTASSTPTNANPALPAFRTFGTPAVTPSRVAPRIRGHYIVAPGSCSSNYSSAGHYFLGVTSGSNVAGANVTAVLGGLDNQACDAGSAVGAGILNVIANGGNALDSFIGAGGSNAITGFSAFIGAGSYNEAAGQSAFVGAGLDGTAQAPGSFVGAGGYQYGQQSGAVAGGGNTADGNDSFIGAGDLNLITSGATASFIGGGGSADLGGGAHNTISAADSFIGAGDNNTVRAQQAFLGGGTGGNVNGTYSGIAAGYGDTVSGVASFAGAGGFNLVSGQDAFVGSGNANTASAAGSFVGAGGTSSSNTGNLASGQDSFVGAGDSNSAKATQSVIGGGSNNSITAPATYSVLAGGHNSTVSGQSATVGGGFDNTAAGMFSVIPGGAENQANGELSFAAGYHAEAVNTGSFVWSDYVNGSPYAADTAANQFVVRASGGTIFYSNEKATSGVELTAGSGAWANLSDRNAKTDIVPLDDASVLARVAALPVSSWQYKSEPGVRHFGPMAQDFYAAFGVGTDDRHITSIDEDGVALAAIKALHRENDRLRSVVESDRAAERDEVSSLRKQLRQIQSLLSNRAHDPSR
jgi:hypothetical protein